MAKNKINVTARHILEQVQTGATVERLFQSLPQGQLPIDYPWLAEFISNRARPDTLFLPDTNFYTRHEVPDSVWNALLGARQVISPFIWKELQPWLTSPFYNRDMARLVVNARGATNSPVLIDEDAPWDDAHFVARQYYVALLSARKQRSRELVEEFTRTHSRPPSSEELNKLIQLHGNDRDFHLLRKGFNDIGKDNFFADEDLVVTAGMVALVGGCDTIILTRDRDVPDQFSKFVDLLTWHYQGMLFAERFSENQEQFKTAPLPSGNPDIDAFFETENSLLVRKEVEPDRFVADLMPADFEAVSIGCFLFGGESDRLTVTPFFFRAERQMDDLLKVKGKTGRLNTDALNGKNCHVTGFPRGIEDPRSWVVVAADKTTEVANPVPPFTCIAKLDYAHTVFHFDRPISLGSSFLFA